MNDIMFVTTVEADSYMELQASINIALSETGEREHCIEVKEIINIDGRFYTTLVFGKQPNRYATSPSGNSNDKSYPSYSGTGSGFPRG